MSVQLIQTGEIPGSSCPKCGAPLAVRTKREIRQHNKHNQFVSCTMFFVTGCDYKTVITPDVVAKMKQVRAQLDAMPAAF